MGVENLSGGQTLPWLLQQFQPCLLCSLSFVMPLQWWCRRHYFLCYPSCVHLCCFCDIYHMHWWIFTKFLSVVHLWTTMNCFGKRSKCHSMTKKYHFRVCFCDISGIHWWIFSRMFLLVLLGTEMNWLSFGVKRSKIKVTASGRTHTELDVIRLDLTV